MLKKVFSLAIVCVILVSSLFLSSCEKEESDFSVTPETAAIDYSAYKGTSINVYNWGEYISDGEDGSPDVNKEFTRLTGIEVNYTNFTSNEDMYSKLKSGGVSYDIVIPSDYMVERLISEGLVNKLDFSMIPNYKYIDPLYKDLYFDSTNEYSVPYNVGTVGIIYNTKQVSYTPDSWSIFMDPDLSDKILMINNPRDAFAIAQFSCQISLNTEDKKDWDKALNWLKTQKNYVKSYVMDEVYNKMESGSAAVAAYYAGDFLTMYENNNDLAFAYPKEGTNIFVDSICIPKACKNQKAAQLYINFLLDPNVALANAETICYASPNTAVVNNPEYEAFLADIHEDAKEILYNYAVNYPDVDLNDYYFHNLSPETLEYMGNLWSSLKIAPTDDSDSYVIYILCAVFAVIIIALVIFFRIRKKRRQNA